MEFVLFVGFGVIKFALQGGGGDAAVSESLTRVKFLGCSQGKINFRGWRGSIGFALYCLPRQEENREKCRT